MKRSDVRNIAIIAHVDHGKTTLVDGLLQQAGAFRRGEVVQECALDSNPLERERGITILAKNTAITWKGVRINIVDTPGHADFGGEVERVLRMVDSVLLLVDAFEGPMPQTRFVTKKALALGLQPDRGGQQDRSRRLRSRTAPSTTSSISSCHLGATDAQLDFPVIYASGRNGYAVHDLERRRRRRADAAARPDRRQGAAARGQPRRAAVHARGHARLRRLPRLRRHRPHHRRARSRWATACCCAHRDGKREEFRVQKVLASQGLKRFEIAEGTAGDIVAVTGMAELNVGETITDDRAADASCRCMTIDEPTISMQFIANDGPFVGQEGKYVTTRNLRERLYKELKSNVALRVEDTELAQHLQGVGPRRAAPVGAHRDHAARRLRAVRVAARGHLQDDRRQEARSRTRRSSSTSTRPTPAR